MLNAASLLDTGALQDFNFPSQQHILGEKKTLSKVMPLTHAVQQNCCKVKVGESQIHGHPGPKKALDGKNGLPSITATPGTIRTAFWVAPIACTAHVPHLGVRKLSASCSCLFHAIAEIVNCLEKNRLQPVREPETEPGRECCCVKPPKTSQQIKK